MKVTQFFVGFGPTLWSFRRGETEYGIKAIPAGGFVKIVGMTPLEEVAPGGRGPGRSGASPLWQRTVVLVAGSVMHFVLALRDLLVAGARAPACPTRRARSTSRRAAGHRHGRRLRRPDYDARQGRACATAGPATRSARPRPPACSPATVIVAVDGTPVATYGDAGRRPSARPPPGPVDDHLRPRRRAPARPRSTSWPTQRPPLDDPTASPSTVSAHRASRSADPERDPALRSGRRPSAAAVDFIGQTVAADLHGARRASRRRSRSWCDAIGGGQRDPDDADQRRRRQPDRRRGRPSSARRIVFLLLLGGAERLHRRLQPAAAAAAGRRPHRGRLATSGSGRWVAAPARPARPGPGRLHQAAAGRPTSWSCSFGGADAAHPGRRHRQPDHTCSSADRRAATRRAERYWTHDRLASACPPTPPRPLAPAPGTRQIDVGGVLVGGDAPVSVQSMTTTLTADVNATLQQIAELTASGCQIVRVAVPDARTTPTRCRRSPGSRRSR